MKILSNLNRNLSLEAHSCLDRLGKRDPGAQVIGWSDQFLSPLIRTGGGQVKIVSPQGRLRKLPAEN
jgi:hypothetical protein